MSIVRPSAFIVSKHALTIDDENYYKINDYSLISSFCRNDYYGEVATFCRNDIMYNEIGWVSLNSVEMNYEVAGINLNNIILTVIRDMYRSPNEDLDDFVKAFSNMLEKCSTKIIIYGDWNTQRCNIDYKYRLSKECINSFNCTK